MDRLIGYVLLGGVVLSVSLVIAGLGWRWVRDGQLNVGYTLPRANLFQFLMLEIDLLVAGELRPRLLISLGIVTLLLTPYLRVAASLVFFAAVAHNWKYAVFTSFVLVVLTYSLFLR
jgi:uncharacterized membrane protein